MSSPAEAIVSNLVDTLIDIRNLKTHFFLDEGTVRAVDGVSFTIPNKKTLGVVGESGCGKSVTAQSILRIVPHPGKIVEGEILLTPRSDEAGTPISDTTTDLAALDPGGAEIRHIRGREIAMIFQEPMTSFSPLHTIGNQICEAILLHQDLDKKGAQENAIQLLKHVGIPKAEQRIFSYPHELSGGMRQRAMIAMALSCNPRLLIADEPTTALDVSIQAQILDLMEELQSEFGMSILFITHDLGVVAEMADEVIVMYWGKVVEQANVDTIFNDPKHPYTRALLRSIPRIGATTKGRLEAIQGVVPHPFARLKGCPFYPRCSEAKEGVCNTGTPPKLCDLGGEHQVSCFLYSDDREPGTPTDESAPISPDTKAEKA
jgi:peptide/nickel transport system ATP-binding protein